MALLGLSIGFLSQVLMEYVTWSVRTERWLALPTSRRRFNRRLESTLLCERLVYSRASRMGVFGEMGGPVGGILFPASLRGGARGLHGDGFYPPDKPGGERPP